MGAQMEDAVRHSQTRGNVFFSVSVSPLLFLLTVSAKLLGEGVLYCVRSRSSRHAQPTSTPMHARNLKATYPAMWTKKMSK